MLLWPCGAAGVRAQFTLTTRHGITGALLLLWTTDIFQGMCWNLQGLTRTTTAFRNNPKKMLSVLLNQLLMKALETSLSKPWLCSAGKGQGNIWAPNSTGEVANESHGIEYFGKKTLSSVRRCGLCSSLSLEEFLGLNHHLTPWPGGPSIAHPCPKQCRH